MAATWTGVSNQQVYQGNNPPFVDAENVTLGGGAGVDWTPTRGTQTRALQIGTGGNLKVDTAAGNIGVVLVVAAGQLNLSVTKVYSTTDGTTAASITALY